MTEPPGLPSALGIEAVEWLAQGADTLTVRVGGRWRRRRPTISGQPLLVIEAGTTRQRFPAMPEPPGLTGAAPGTWQLSFSVPTALARREGARAWLQLGSIVVPLPVPVIDEPSPPDDETLAQRRIRAAELAAESATHRVAEARAETQRLADRAAELERELAQQTDLARARDSARRAAEQREHAERALRLELEERLAVGGVPPPPVSDAGDRALRLEELEEEVARLQRAVDEAQQVARAAEVARRHAEERLGALGETRTTRPFAGSLQAELGLVHGLEPVAATPLSAPDNTGDQQRLDRERELVASRRRPGTPPASDPGLTATLDELRAELAALHEQIAQAVADRARAQRRAAELERALSERSARSAQILAVIEQLRVEIAQARARAEQSQPIPAPPASETEAPASEETQTPSVSAAAPPVAPPESQVSAGPVDAQRLAAALTRLRESAPLPGPGPVMSQPAVRSARWLAPALRTVARRDPDNAPALLGALLVASDDEARDAANLLALGAVRRRWRAGFTRLRGRRERFAALRQLLRTPVGMADISLEPQLAFALAAAMIRPRWTVGERFTLAYDAGPYMHVRDGSPVSVTAAPLATVATTILCRPAALLGVLAGAGEGGPATSILGQQRPLELVQAWLQRAQSR
jgi:hypothetical protein